MPITNHVANDSYDTLNCSLHTVQLESLLEHRIPLVTGAVPLPIGIVLERDAHTTYTTAQPRHARATERTTTMPGPCQ